MIKEVQVAVVKKEDDTVSKVAKLMGSKAMIDATIKNRPIVYMENNTIVKEYPNGYKEITERGVVK